MTISIMLDLETWGTTPGCDIRSIGAVVFDPVAGAVASYDPHSPEGSKITELDGLFYIACDNPMTLGSGSWDRPKYPLHRDPTTAQWWSEQSDDAQAAFADPVDLWEALRQFDRWLTDVAPEQRTVIKSATGEHAVSTAPLWSHGAATDGPWLAAAYKAVGLPVPWHYRAPRDTRTLFDVVGITDHSAWMADRPGPLGIPHHALDDSICQARAVCDAWALLRA